MIDILFHFLCAIITAYCLLPTLHSHTFIATHRFMTIACVLLDKFHAVKGRVYVHLCRFISRAMFYNFQYVSTRSDGQRLVSKFSGIQLKLATILCVCGIITIKKRFHCSRQRRQAAKKVLIF